MFIENIYAKLYFSTRLELNETIFNKTFKNK